MNLSYRVIHPRRMVGAAVAIGLILAGGAGAQTVTPDARGGALVASHCARCHATGKAGDSPNPQAPPFRRLHERYPVASLAEALVEGIRVGHPPMPGFQFSSQDALDIIAYLESVQSDSPPALAPAATPPTQARGDHRR